MRALVLICIFSLACAGCNKDMDKNKLQYEKGRTLELAKIFDLKYKDEVCQTEHKQFEIFDVYADRLPKLWVATYKEDEDGFDESNRTDLFVTAAYMVNYNLNQHRAVFSTSNELGRIELVMDYKLKICNVFIIRHHKFGEDEVYTELGKLVPGFIVY